jgi:hypothetical protein
MPVIKPFRRTYRPFVKGHRGERQTDYILDKRFADDPQHYIRAFKVIEKDMLELFDYVEPADQNEDCYSFRMHELLMRTCIEVEANCKAILNENKYHKKGDLDMNDYKKLNATHKLSEYEVKFTVWRGTSNVRRPFSAWASGNTLAWYQAYNAAKHDRHNEFERANFANVLQTISALVVLLSSQFYTKDFGHIDYLVASFGDEHGFIPATTGGYLLVRYPELPDADRYAFDWEKLKNDPDPFGTLQF